MEEQADRKAAWYEAQRKRYIAERDKWAAILADLEAAVGKQRNEFLSTHMMAACMEAAQVVAYLNIRLSVFTEEFGK